MSFKKELLNNVANARHLQKLNAEKEFKNKMSLVEEAALCLYKQKDAKAEIIKASNLGHYCVVLDYDLNEIVEKKLITNGIEIHWTMDKLIQIIKADFSELDVQSTDYENKIIISWE